jgi:hypothetical protein
MVEGSSYCCVLLRVANAVTLPYFYCIQDIPILFDPSLHWHQNFQSLTGVSHSVSLILRAINEIVRSGYEL